MCKCIYCNIIQKCNSLHFACDICGNGMCDACYDKGTEHDRHIYHPLDMCDNELEIKLISEKCGKEDPDYICEICMHEIMTDKHI